MEGKNVAVSLNERPVLKGPAAEKFFRRHNELEKKAQERAARLRAAMACRHSAVEKKSARSEGTEK